MSAIETKGTASRVLSVILRLGELVCGVIVLGLLCRLFYLVDNAGVTEPNGRLVFSAVIAGLTILAALVLMPPMAYSFWSFPVDIFFFAAWLAVFCLLETASPSIQLLRHERLADFLRQQLTGINTCESEWYNSYWGYYWGRWYLVSPVGINVNWTGCSAWKTVLAFSMIASIAFLMSAILVSQTFRSFLRRVPC